MKGAALGLGCAGLGGLYEPLPEAEAQATLEAAWTGGIRCFDTAPHYGVGLSEERLGRFLRGIPRAHYTLSTKVGRLLVEDPDAPTHGDGFFGTPRRRRVPDYSAAGVRRSVEESLRRLGLDRLDIVLVHDPDEHWEQASQEAIPALAELRDQGVVGAIGAGMNQSGMLGRFVTETDVDCVLIAGRYTLLDRGGSALLDRCAELGVSVLAGGVYNSGLLADPRPGARFDYAPADPDLLARALRLDARCAARGIPLRAAALGFAAEHRAVDTVLVGARNPAEVRDAVAMAAVDIPTDLWEQLG
ncbi:aldo/keto reductase (plasmid) [Embleya sp. NBC_00888]|uniref:aldo/keto reductase n=1 Tax=Embleya sp. NBC_00888 TaxID=2975960 RepID=UPI002F90840D|nr:aldo/keto reductase [Embleya sp. NBC_00888]